MPDASQQPDEDAPEMPARLSTAASGVVAWVLGVPYARVALPLSVALHAVLLLALGMAPWPMPAPRTAGATEVVWLGSWPEPAPPPPAPAPEPVVPPPESSASPAPEAPNDEAGPATVEPPEATTVRERAEPEAEAEAEESAAPPVASEEERAESEPGAAVDWAAAQRDALATARAEYAREQAIRTAEPGDGGGADGADAVGEKLFDHCHAIANPLKRKILAILGGGFGFCVRAPYDDLFAAIKPEYLSKRPFCEPRDPVPQGEALVADAANVQTNRKCRLVTEEEYAELTASPAAE